MHPMFHELLVFFRQHLDCSVDSHYAGFFRSFWRWRGAEVERITSARHINARRIRLHMHDITIAYANQPYRLLFLLRGQHCGCTVSHLLYKAFPKVGDYFFCF